MIGYPATMAAEGDIMAKGRDWGEFDPYIHTSNDTMYVDDKTGKFSVEVSTINLWNHELLLVNSWMRQY
jgi:hypothetical protein